MTNVASLHTLANYDNLLWISTIGYCWSNVGVRDSRLLHSNDVRYADLDGAGRII